MARSRAYHFSLRDLGVAEDRLIDILPGINTQKFTAAYRDEALWQRIGVPQKHRLLYAGRVSVEKNLPLLVDAFKKLCATRSDVALIIAGDGPYLETMKAVLRDLPAKFLGYQDDAQLRTLYASADLFVFPSRTDTLGQVVMEAQACGLPVLVSDEGGPREIVEDGVTGRILPAAKPADAVRWVATIDALLNDASLRARMSGAAAHRIASKFSLDRTFEHFWATHVDAVEPPEAQSHVEVKQVPSPQTLQQIPSRTAR